MKPHNIHKSPVDTVSYGFFSNAGGVSSDIYESLNCGPGSNDDEANVAENRKRAAYMLSDNRQTPVLSCYQIHSNIVETVSHDWADNRPKADAMVTAKPGLILGILTADCTPVLFFDPAAHIIGAAHAGWKGALNGVLENTVTAMEALGASRKNITAMIGPTIHQASYEVGADFYSTFISNDTSYQGFFAAGKDSDHYQFDLPGFVEHQLAKAGINATRNTGIDTYTSPHHFSYRRTTHRQEKDYGRQLSAIMLMP